MVNRVILVGNLTRDAENLSATDRAMTRMRIATNSYWRDALGNRQSSAEYHSVVAFGRLGEICAQYCHRGKRVYVEGRLRTREFDGKDGLKRTSTEVVAETLTLLQPRDRTENAEELGEEDAPLAASA